MLQTGKADMSTQTKQRERSLHNITAGAEEHPYHRASFSLGHRVARQVWEVVYLLLYRTTPRPLHGWRVLLLRLFGAKMGKGCHFYPSGKVWAPWNLVCGDYCTLADKAEIYNPSSIHLGTHCIISQQAYICGGTHDYHDPDFPMISYGMRLGADAWICARASVSPGVNVGEGAVLGLGSVAAGDLEPWSVYAGVPAVKIKARERKTTLDQEMA